MDRHPHLTLAAKDHKAYPAFRESRAGNALEMTGEVIH
jgi:hypothetical protein